MLHNLLRAGQSMDRAIKKQACQDQELDTWYLIVVCCLRNIIFVVASSQYFYQLPKQAVSNSM